MSEFFLAIKTFILHTDFHFILLSSEKDPPNLQTHPKPLCKQEKYFEPEKQICDGEVCLLAGSGEGVEQLKMVIE